MKLHRSRGNSRCWTCSRYVTGGSEHRPSFTDTCGLVWLLIFMWFPFSHTSRFLFFLVFLTGKYLNNLSDPCIFDGKEYLKLHLWYWNVSRPKTSIQEERLRQTSFLRLHFKHKSDYASGGALPPNHLTHLLVDYPSLKWIITQRKFTVD